MDTELRRGVSRSDVWLPALLLAVAGLGWWWSVASVASMTAMPPGAQSKMSLVGFLFGWVAMMAAMMLPALLPVLGRYSRAAGGKVVPVAAFVGGYLAIWAAVGIPAFVASVRFNPMANGWAWFGRIVGAVALIAGLHQLSRFKATCLRHCRWPVSLPAEPGQPLKNLGGALLAGGRYGIYCLGSCFMLMLLLIAFGTMQLAWMLGLSVVIWLEKVATFGDQLRRLTAAALIVLGGVLLVYPTVITHLVA